MKAKQPKTHKTMTREEYISEADRIDKMKADLNIRYSKEHPIMKRFGGKVIKVYDIEDKEWTPPFRLRKVRYGYRGHDVIEGNLIEDGVEKTALMVECGAASLSDIQVCDKL